jgi:hypothetical protein
VPAVGGCSQCAARGCALREVSLCSAACTLGRHTPTTNPHPTHPPLPLQAGIPEFCLAAATLALGANSAVLRDRRNATVQALSGTGALRVGGEFLARFYSRSSVVLIPTPSWPNHRSVFERAGLTVQHYRYYHPQTLGLDYEVRALSPLMRPLPLVAPCPVRPFSGCARLYRGGRPPAAALAGPGSWAPCCVVLCCAVLCCAVPCRALLEGAPCRLVLHGVAAPRACARALPGAKHTQATLRCAPRRNQRRPLLVAQGLLADLNAAPAGAAVILHACAHNPTGVDPTPEQWAGILGAVRARGLLPFFDSAYQGFASGDLERDGAAVRLFADAGLEMLLAQVRHGDPVVRACDVRAMGGGGVRGRGRGGPLWHSPRTRSRLLRVIRRC